MSLTIKEKLQIDLEVEGEAYAEKYGERIDAIIEKRIAEAVSKHQSEVCISFSPLWWYKSRLLSYMRKHSKYRKLFTGNGSSSMLGWGDDTSNEFSFNWSDFSDLQFVAPTKIRPLSAGEVIQNVDKTNLEGEVK